MINYNEYDNETQMQIDESIFGCRVFDKEGKRIDPAIVRIGQDDNIIYNINGETPQPIEATIKITYK